MNKDFKNIRVAVIGGDKRQGVVARELINLGCSVRMLAIGDKASSFNGGELCGTLEKAVEGCRVIVLPLPVTRDNIHLSADGVKVELCDIVRLAARSNAIILGGMIPQEMVRLCDSFGVEVCDYYKSEELQRKNALPSAEGALMIAMEHTDVTVKGMRTLITGYGRIGSLLADMLDKLGAHVTVAARRDETLCEISMRGINAVRIDGNGNALAEAANNCQVIFNTVPSVIFTEKVLKQVKRKPLYIEIASSPGGVDLYAARDAGIETVFAPSLPGKYSPISAGGYVFETVFHILTERRIL